MSGSSVALRMTFGPLATLDHQARSGPSTPSGRRRNHSGTEGTVHEGVVLVFAVSSARTGPMILLQQLRWLAIVVGHLWCLLRMKALIRDSMTLGMWDTSPPM